MAISGIPPFNGFFSKLLIILAAIQAKFYLLAALAVIVSIITLASFMKFQRYAFFGGPQKRYKGNTVREVPFFMAFAMVVMALLCLGLSLLMVPPIREAVLQPAVDILLGNTENFIHLLNK